jgi:signal transduction histidine kinase
MTRRVGTRRFPRGLALPDLALLPKVMAAFLVALLVSVAVTLALDTRLTRAELRDQTRVLSVDQGRVLDRLLREERVRTSQSVEALAQEARISVDQSEVDLLKLLRLVRLSNALELGDVVSATSGEVVVGSSSRWHVEPPGPLDDDVLEDFPPQRVVELAEGGFGLVYTSAIDVMGPDRLLLAVGYPLDDRRAEGLRSATGADEVEIVVDGRVVAATSADLTSPSGDWRREGEVQEATDPGRRVRYVPLASEGAWSHRTAVGLVIEDPLAPLDARLARSRVLIGALLMGLAGLLAYGVSRLMTRPLQELTGTASRIAGGELEASFDVDRRDEIGTLARALERMRRALHYQVRLIREQADALRDAARRIVGAQDAERRRLAQDLHDGIQQRLVLLRMEVGLARARLRQDPAAVDEVSEELAERIDSLLDELRATGQALFPAILRDRGLGGALFSLAARSGLPIEVRLEPDPLPRLAPEVETGAYFLVSEAVTNALKHARADRIEVVVSHAGDALHVVVVDDGAGFDTTRVTRQGGLVHMRDRVNALGGRLRVVPSLAEGTRIEAALPLSDEGTLQEEQHGGHPAVELDLLGEAELPEDGVGVLLDRPVGDRQLPGDGEVAPSRRHQGQDVELPWRESGEP